MVALQGRRSAGRAANRRAIRSARSARRHGLMSSSTAATLYHVVIRLRLVALKRRLGRGLSKVEFEQLAQFRYQLRRFLRLSEEVTRRRGITTLQYQLLLQIKGFPGASGRAWASSRSACRRGITAWSR